MKQNGIKARFEKTEAELLKINEADDQFLYVTKDKYIPKRGYIHEMTIKELLKTKKDFNKRSSNTFEKEMEELGVKNTEIDSTDIEKFLGVKITNWDSDMKTRIAQIRLEEKVANLKNDLVILQRNLDEKSLQSIDLAQLSNVEL